MTADEYILVVGSIILPEKISGAASVLKPEHFGCANAIGSAISKVSGTYEKLMNYDELPREQSLEKAKSEAVELAAKAGAVRETVEIIEMEDAPLAYVFPKDSVDFSMVVGHPFTVIRRTR